MTFNNLADRIMHAALIHRRVRCCVVLTLAVSSADLGHCQQEEVVRLLSKGKTLRLRFDVMHTQPALPEQVINARIKQFSSNAGIVAFWSARRQARELAFSAILELDDGKIAWRCSKEGDAHGRTRTVTYNGKKTVTWYDSPTRGQQQMHVWPGLALSEFWDVPYVLSEYERPPLIDESNLTPWKQKGQLKFFRSRSAYRPAAREKSEGPLFLESTVKAGSDGAIEEVIVGSESAPYERWRFTKWKEHGGAMLPGKIDYVQFSQFPELGGRAVSDEELSFSLLSAVETKFAGDNFDANAPPKGTPVQDERYEEPPTAGGGKPRPGGVSYYFSAKNPIDVESQIVAAGVTPSPLKLTVGGLVRLIAAVGFLIVIARVLLMKRPITPRKPQGK